MVLNDTRVIKARLIGRKKTGGRVEVMVERVLGGGEVLAQVGANHPTRVGSKLVLAGGIEATVLGRESEFFRLRFEKCDDVFALLDRHGSMPLPMYIGRPAGEDDAERYQTVYAREPGAVAAPTAGLHFDEALLDLLRSRSAGIARITLHVGAGTFQPVRVQNPAQHEMHGEWYDVPQRRWTRSTARAPGRARAGGGHDDAARARKRGGRRDVRAPAAARPGCSSCPATASAWSSACSPTSTCPGRRC